jgi:archaellum component FlaC
MARNLRDTASSAEVIAEFRESLESETKSRLFHAKYPEFCDKTMAFFEDIGDFAMRAVTKDDMKEITDAIQKHADQIGTHDRRLNDLDYRVKHLEQLVTHTKIAVDTNTAIARQTLQLVEIQDKKLDALQRPAVQIPAIAWPIIGVVALAAVAALAGEMAGFIRWLGTIKIFGV